jgi:hypothetical protein
MYGNDPFTNSGSGFMMRRHQGTLSLIEALEVNYHCDGSPNSRNHNTEFHNVGYSNSCKTLILAMKPFEFGGLTNRTDGKADNENAGHRPMHRLVAECLTISKILGGFQRQTRIIILMQLLRQSKRSLKSTTSISLVADYSAQVDFCDVKTDRSLGSAQIQGR